MKAEDSGDKQLGLSPAQRFGRVGGGVMLALTASFGATACEPPHISLPGVGSHVKEADISPIVTELTPENLSKIKAAVKIDDCDTRVTAAQVAQTYATYFGTVERGNLTFDQLSTRANQTIDHLNDDKSAIPSMKLPSDFKALQKDAGGPNVLPYSQYQKAAKIFFKQVGIKAYFDWDTSGYNEDITQDFLAQYMHPIDRLRTGKDSISRSVITGVMANAAAMPETTVRQAQLKAIAFGDIPYDSNSDVDSAGEDFSAQHTMLFDISENIAAQAPDLALFQTKTIFGHEITHQKDHQMGCDDYNSAIYNLPPKDPAYTSFSAMRYGAATVKKLANNGNDGHGRITLGADDSNGYVSVTNPYGATNAGEDKATSVGEFIYSPLQIPRLFNSNDAKQLSPLWFKTAYEMTRLNIADAQKNGNSDSATFYADVFAAARVVVALQDQCEPLIKKRVDREVALDRQRATPDQFNSDPERNALSEQIAPYDKLIDRLEAAYSGPLA